MKTITAVPPAHKQTLSVLRGVSEPRVDRERGIIFGAAIIQKGNLNDSREAYVDGVTLEQTVSLMRRPGKGVKALESHANMSDDGFGKYLGRWHNARLSDGGDAVLADLHLSQLARKGEDSRGQYVLDMADQEPDTFGVSLAPIWDSAAMNELEPVDGRRPLRFSSLRSADIVGDPAATRGGLFGDAQLSIATAPLLATQVLDSLFADATSEVIHDRCLGFVNTYLANRFGSPNPVEANMADTNQAVSLTRDDVQAIVGETVNPQLAALDAKLAQLIGQKAEAEVDTQHKEELAAERTRTKELYALARVAGVKEPEKRAEEWIDQGLSVVAAKAAIADTLMAGNSLSRDAGDGNADPDSKYRAEYSAQAAAFASMGLSQQEYIASRRIEDGLELLTTK